MKLTVLPSGHGDCLMLESGGKRMLIDGGVSKAFREEVLPWLAKTGKKPIDCIYVSHIDNDHLGGLIELLDAVYQWRVYSYRRKKTPPPKKPAFEPPPLVKIWHNVFSDVLGENAQPVTAALSQTAAMLSGLESNADPQALKLKDYHDNLAEGVKEALRIAYRVGPKQLGLKVNPEYKNKLMLFDPDAKKRPKLTLGKANFTLLAPRVADLEKLRKSWNDWLRDHQSVVKDIRKKAAADSDGLSSAAGLIEPMLKEATELAANIDIAFKDSDLGKRKKVTTPNLASLMFLAEEGSQSLLLTGDGHADDILTGLKERKKLAADGTLHVDILKVPHHGAEFNTTPEFAERVTARHYIFCGNGFQGNPEKIVLKTYVEARKKVGGGKYKFWFNSKPDTGHKHMDELAELVRELKQDDPNLSFEFRDKPFVVPFR